MECSAAERAGVNSALPSAVTLLPGLLPSPLFAASVLQADETAYHATL